MYLFISKIKSIDEINDKMKSILNYESKMISFLNDDKLQSIINIEQQINFVNQKITQLNNEINILDIENIKNTINIKSIEILNILLFLNNIRLLLYSRKYVNTILTFEVKKNKKLRLSKNKYLIDFAGLKYKEEKLIKNYISNFIVMVNANDNNKNEIDNENNNIINNNNNNDTDKDTKIYNLTLDFLYFIKNYFNNNVHLVSPVRNLNYNTLFFKIFTKYDTKENSEEEISENDQNGSNKGKSKNGKKEEKYSSIIYNKEEEDEEKKIIAYNIPNKGEEIIKGQKKSEEIISEQSNELEDIIEKKEKKILEDCFMDIYTSDGNFINKNNNNKNKINISEYSFKDNEEKNKDIDINYIIKNIKSFSFEALKEDINQVIELNTDIKIEASKNVLIDYEKEINNILGKPDFFSIKELQKNSVDNLKNVFVKYFAATINEKVLNKYIPLLNKENIEINNKFQLILDRIDYYGIFLEIFLNNRKEIYNHNNKLLDTYIELSIENIKALIPNVTELKGKILALKNTLEKYKKKKLLFEVINNQKEEVSQSINNDQDVLTFENLFEKWKLQYSQNNIDDIKKKLKINLREKKYKIMIKNKITEVEYLYESKEYLKYIDIDLMNKLNV